MGDKRDLLLGMATVWLVGGYFLGRGWTLARRYLAEQKSAKGALAEGRNAYRAARKTAYRQCGKVALGLIALLAFVAATIIYVGLAFPEE